MAGVLISIILLLPALEGGFFSDDNRYIVENEVLLQTPVAKSFRFFTSGMPHGEYLPLRDISYAIDLALFGVNPRGFHFHNILLYVLTCGATWLLARQISRALGRPPSSVALIAGLTTLFFALHPTHVEAAAWISGRKDLLAGLFMILSLWMAALAVDGERMLRGRIVACWVFAGLALLAKTSALPISASIFLVVTACSPGWLTARNRLLRAASVAVPILLLAITNAAFAMTHYSTMNVGFSAELPLIDTIARAFVILGKHTLLACIPLTLRLTHPLEHWGNELPGLILGIVTVILSGIGVWKVAKHRSFLGLAVALFPIHLVPVLHLFNTRTWSFIGERFLFLPTLALALLLAAMLNALAEKKGAFSLASYFVAFLIVAVWLPVFGFRAWDWRDEHILFSANAASAPQYHLAQYYGIKEEIKRLRFEPAEHLARRVADEKTSMALLAYVEAARLVVKARDTRTIVSAGERVIQTQQLAKALQREVAPWDNPRHLFAMNLQADTIPLYDRLLTIDPENTSLNYNQGLMLLKFGRYSEAADRLRFAAGDERWSPKIRAEALNNLGLALKCSGDRTGSIAVFRRALKIDTLHWRAAANLALIDTSKQLYYRAELRRRAGAAGHSQTEIERFVAARGSCR